MRRLLSSLWGSIAGSAATIYAVLGALGAATISILVLLLQRNSARSDAKEQRARADQAEGIAQQTKQALERQTDISVERSEDTERAIKERNELAQKSPDSAGDLLERVLSHPTGTSTPTPLFSQPSTTMGPPKDRSKN